MPKKVADALHVTPDVIKNFDEEKVINIFSNTFQDNSSCYNHYPTFNPIDKMVQLYDEKIAFWFVLFNIQRLPAPSS